MICTLALALAACGSTPTVVVLEGTVTDAYTGEPVADAQVTIGELTVETDASGTYRTTEWQSDSSRLAVTAPGYAARELPLETPGEEPVEETPLITVTLDTELRPSTLQGIVLDAFTGDPLAGAEIVAETTDATGPISTTTDDTGSYALDGVTEAITLTANLDNYAAAQVALEQTTEYNLELRPNVVVGTVTDQYSDDPIAGAVVQVGAVQVTTDDSGSYRLENLPDETSEITIAASGYATFVEPLDQRLEVDAVLRPDVLQATLIDEESGAPIEFATIIASEGLTSTATTSVRIDNSSDGSFTLNDLPEQGYVQVLAPGYRKAVLEISPGNIPARIEMEPFYARALYVKTTTAAWLPERMENFYDVIDRTELNALVIDLKSDNLADLGLIYYESQVPIIQELGTSQDLMDIRAILAEAKRRDIYTIARIHVFSHDNLLAETMPEWAAQDANGCVPNENRLCNGDIFYADWDIAWLDPWNRNVWDYNIQLGVEAAQMGFDEIQFDYIRFPSDASEIDQMRLSGPHNWRDPEERDAMFNNIVNVLTEAHEAFNDVGAFFSVDIFGYAVWAPQAMIGQSADLMAPHADYIYPMVYPSHFWVNELGFENAAAHPYEIVYESMEYGQDMVGGKRAKMRPWLQDFTLVWVPDHLIVEYGIPEVRAQINAAEDSPYTAGWAVWDPDNEYTLGAFE